VCVCILQTVGWSDRGPRQRSGGDAEKTNCNAAGSGREWWSSFIRPASGRHEHRLTGHVAVSWETLRYDTRLSLVYRTRSNRTFTRETSLYDLAPSRNDWLRLTYLNNCIYFLISTYITILGLFFPLQMHCISFLVLYCIVLLYSTLLFV